MLVGQLIRDLSFNRSFVIGYFVIRHLDLTRLTWETIRFGATSIPVVGTRIRHQVPAPVGPEQQLALALRFPDPVRRAFAWHLPRA